MIATETDVGKGASLFLGLDVGKSKHAAAGIDDAGRETLKPMFFDNTREGFKNLVAAIDKVAPRESTQVGLEATGSYWFALHDFLVEAGYSVTVINPLVSASAIAGDIRGRKTDKGDAIAIAQVIRAGKAKARYSSDTSARALVALTRQRSFLIRQRSDQKRRLQCHLATIFPELLPSLGNTLSSFAINLLMAYPTAKALSRAHRTAVAKIVKKHTHGKDADKEADRLVQLAKTSVAVSSDVSDALAIVVRSTVEMIIGFTDGIAELEKAIHDSEAPKFASIIGQIKGAGTILPKTIASEYGDISRFEITPEGEKQKPLWKKLMAYAGAEPKIRQSGNWTGRPHMSKRGSGALRTALIQIAFTICRNDEHFKAVYDKQIARGKHHTVALSFVAQELIKVACSLWKSGRTYTVARPAPKSASEAQSA